MIFMSIGQLIGHLSNRYGYTDPGSASILLQLLLAGLLGAGILLRSYWSRIRKFFRRDKADQTDDDDDGNDE